MRALGLERGAILPVTCPLAITPEPTNSLDYNCILLSTTAAWVQPGSEGHIGKIGGFTLGKLLRHETQVDKARPLLPRGDKVSTLTHLREWLEASEKDLNSWSDRLRNTVLPTRVLDLGSTGGDTPPSPDADLCLWETSEATDRYATLSYFWGGYTDFGTLKSNLKERCSKIKFLEMPSLFQQAVTVTRGLGIRYLWIDALCIIQDDRDDWSVKAAKMSSVYWNGACKLVVTHCQNPAQNFFPPKEIIASVKYEKVKSKEPPKMLVTLPKLYSRDIDDGHLNTRGWVLQERLLAPKTIHFTESHIYCEDQDICGEDWVRR
ncbi:heterokaryon incompatibility protein-domain-containing protein [Amylocarpus encephaloides]|uniref:Heterokaryon incompatibility protein-domain-containing protein n=1 Tax=Amylocarpus encephaloides TaxID=45428 RepID=A0A9P7YG28_9HELO|nr:heterokaryon incompatibility protein-domain-containing protein [Amylocarpus encephaloides]